MRQRRTPSPEKGRTLRIVIKLGVLMCLFAILFGMIVLVAGGVLAEGNEETDVPPVFAWMGASACGLFTLGTLLGLGGWLVGVLIED